MHPRTPLNGNNAAATSMGSSASSTRGTAAAAAAVATTGSSNGGGGGFGPRVPSVSRNNNNSSSSTAGAAHLLPSPTAFYHRHHHHSSSSPPSSSPHLFGSPSPPNNNGNGGGGGLNPSSEINARLDTQVEVRVYPCNNNNNNNNTPNNNNNKKKFTQFHVKPEGVIIQGTNSTSRNNHHRSSTSSSTNNNNNYSPDLGHEYSLHIGRKLQRYELSDTRACQLLVTTHHKSYWVVPAPEAFSRHSGTCRLLGDRKHPPTQHILQCGDFLRVGSVGVVVIETHDGKTNYVLSEEKIQKIMRDTTSNNNNGNGNSGMFSDLAETDGDNSDDDDSSHGGGVTNRRTRNNTTTLHPTTTPTNVPRDVPTCYMCFDEEDTPQNPMITPCKCLGDTRYVHVDCLRKWHTAEADNQVCFLSSVDATCSVCKTTFRSDFKLKDGRFVKLFKSSLEPPYISLLVATKHEMAQRLFNTRFQLSFATLLKPDGRNGTRPLLLGRSSGSDMVLDYRTVSARHATIRLKNGEFVFVDAGSSNGSYLYMRKPVELVSNQPVQFRLGRSMISMRVVNKWNRRFLRAVSRRAVGLGVGGGSGGGGALGLGGSGGMIAGEVDNRSVGSNEDDVRITSVNGEITRNKPRRTREYIMSNLPPIGTLSQGSPQHLDLLFALAYPCKQVNTGEKEHQHQLVVRSSSRRGGGSVVVAEASSAAQVLDPLGMRREEEEEEEVLPEYNGLNLNDNVADEEEEEVAGNNAEDEEKHLRTSPEEVGQDEIPRPVETQGQKQQQEQFDSPGSYNSGIGDVDVTDEEEVVVVGSAVDQRAT